jgi:hypothetical protein
MDRRTVRRGLAVLALALGLTLAGVQPAAAEEPGLWGSLGRLLGLWESREGGVGSLWDTMAGWFTEKTSVSPDDSTTERGAGLDPNGNSLEASGDPSQTPRSNG